MYKRKMKTTVRYELIGYDSKGKPMWDKRARKYQKKTKYIGKNPRYAVKISELEENKKRRSN